MQKRYQIFISSTYKDLIEERQKVKIRIYPNKEQITQIEKTIGCSRFLYNRMLADKIRYYQEDKKMLRNTPAGYKKNIHG